jgi:chorismate mutase
MIPCAVFLHTLIGKFVSESKFIENPAAFIGPIRSRDREALEALITKPEVERCLVKRVRRKATQYAVAFDREGSPTPVDAEMQCVTTIGKFDIENVIGELYEKYVIPLTKEVEVSRTVL